MKQRNIKIIKSKSNILDLKFKELFSYRELILLLAQRDLKVRYTQTILGFLWALINPLLTMIILIIVFHKVAKVDTDPVPYYLFVIIGITSWTYISSMITEGGNSIVASHEIIKKVYFPRLAIPLSKALSVSVELLVSFAILIILFIYSGVPLSQNIIYLPLVFILILVSGITAGIWISALSVRYRDFKFVPPFLVKMGLYITPIAYPIDMVPDKFKGIVLANPITGVIEGVRWSMIGEGPFDSSLWVSIGLLLILFVLGLLYFKSVESIMADIL